MSGESDPVRLLDRVVSGCFIVLLSAMALYGAVRIIASIWLPICIGLASLAAVAGAWLLVRRLRGF